MAGQLRLLSVLRRRAADSRLHILHRQLGEVPAGAVLGEFSNLRPPTAAAHTPSTCCLTPPPPSPSSTLQALGIVLGFAAKPELGPFGPIGEDDHRGGELSHAETVIIIFLQVGGWLLWTYVLASMVDMVTSHDSDARVARQQLLAVERFCAFHKLPKKTCQQLRECTPLKKPQ